MTRRSRLLLAVVLCLAFAAASHAEPVQPRVELAPAPPSGEVDPTPPRVEVEVGAYHYDLDGESDWDGERVLLRTKAGGILVLQFEANHEVRGSDEATLGAAACWVDVAPRAYVFASAAAASGDDFFAEGRASVELHVKLGPEKRTVLGAGVGVARFDADDVTMLTGGLSHYFPKVVLSYRFFHFESEPRKGALGKGGSGDTHLIDVMVLDENSGPGRFDFRFLSGTDVLREFETDGRNGFFDSKVASLAWRRYWSKHLGTHVQVEWAEKEDISSRQGAEIRLLLR